MGGRPRPERSRPTSRATTPGSRTGTSWPRASCCRPPSSATSRPTRCCRTSCCRRTGPGPRCVPPTTPTTTPSRPVGRRTSASGSRPRRSVRRLHVMGDDRLYFRQLLSGRDFATTDPVARQMVNFVYLIGDRETGEAVVIDPAYGIKDLLAVLDEDGMTLVGALATHYHPDHVGGEMAGYSIAGV